MKNAQQKEAVSLLSRVTLINNPQLLTDIKSFLAVVNKPTEKKKSVRYRRKKGEHLFADCGGCPRCVTCGADEDDAFIGGQECDYGKTWQLSQTCYTECMNTITSAEFQRLIKSSAILKTQANRWRFGQVLFNILSEINPELANEIRGTKNDPFAVDNNIPAFFNFLTERIKD